MRYGWHAGCGYPGPRHGYEPVTMPQTYLITGASSGIGLATAQALARQGENLVLVARAPAALDEARRACEHLGSACLVVPADVRDAGEISAAMAAAVDRFGTLDGVVHGAAVAAFGRFEDVPEEVFAETIATNLLGTAIVARAALARFRSQGGGRLVVVSSVLGSMAVPWMSPYIASKWAVNGLVRTLQIETRDDPRIRISLVAPGGVDTPIYRLGATYLGRHGRPPPPVQQPDAVARRVLRALSRPRRRIWSSPVVLPAVALYHVAPALFDALAMPAMRRFGVEQAPGVAPSSGNVLAPTPRDQGLTRAAGRWRPPRAPHATAGRSSYAPDPGPSRLRPRPLGGTPMTATLPGVIVSRDIDAPADAVWQVLCDGWTYANWVVGASRVRDVEPDWPAQGSRIHHAVGPWPLLIQDSTSAMRSIPERELALRARGWPLGEADVVLVIDPTGPQACRVSISEDAVAGPGRLAPHRLRQAMIAPRNREALYRLALIAEGRHRNRQLNRTSDGSGTAYAAGNGSGTGHATGHRA